MLRVLVDVRVDDSGLERLRSLPCAEVVLEYPGCGGDIDVL